MKNKINQFIETEFLRRVIIDRSYGKKNRE